jgi:hypothetical protein
VVIFPAIPVKPGKPLYKRLYKNRKIILDAKKPIIPIQIIYKARRIGVPRNLIISPPDKK